MLGVVSFDDSTTSRIRLGTMGYVWLRGMVCGKRWIGVVELLHSKEGLMHG